MCRCFEVLPGGLVCSCSSPGRRSRWVFGYVGVVEEREGVGIDFVLHQSKSDKIINEFGNLERGSHNRAFPQWACSPSPDNCFCAFLLSQVPSKNCNILSNAPECPFSCQTIKSASLSSRQNMTAYSLAALRDPLSHS